MPSRLCDVMSPRIYSLDGRAHSPPLPIESTVNHKLSDRFVDVHMVMMMKCVCHTCCFSVSVALTTAVGGTIMK